MRINNEIGNRIFISWIKTFANVAEAIRWLNHCQISCLQCDPGAEGHSKGSPGSEFRCVQHQLFQYKKDGCTAHIAIIIAPSSCRLQCLG